MPTQLGTGDLVISVSEIFDRLQTKVDPTTLEQLLRDILAGRRNQVRPGELITAELINQILAELESLQVRVTKLEAGGAVVTPTTPAPTPVRITDLLPHGTRRVGEELNVVGENFLTPAEANNVTVGGIRVVVFKSVSDANAGRSLVFDIPKVSPLADAGTPVPVRVENKNGSDSRQLALQPALDFPTGNLALKYTTAPVLTLARPNIELAQTYDFIFTLTATVNKEATYNLSRTLTATGWAAQILNVSNNEPLSQMTIPGNLAGEQRQLRVRVTAPTGGSTTTTLALSATETSGGNRVTPGNEQIVITVGQPPPKPETRVTVNFNAPDSGITQVGNRLQFKRGTLGLGTFDLTVREAGKYRVTASLRSPTGWTLGQPTAGVPFEINIPSVPTGGSSGPQDFGLALTAAAGAADTELIFTTERIANGDFFSTTHAQPISVI